MFYKDIDGKTPLAQNCYVTRVQQATHSITHTSRRHRFGICSIASGPAECNFLCHPALTASEPVHMHMRYGNADSSFRELLNLSTPENKNINLVERLLCSRCVSGGL